MGIFTCDKKGCERRAYAELFYSGDGETSRWCYTCFWLYLYSRLFRFLKKADFGWCKVDTDREAIEHIRYELWDIQSDIMEIKEKLGIKDESLEEFEKNLDVT